MRHSCEPVTKPLNPILEYRRCPLVVSVLHRVYKHYDLILMTRSSTVEHSPPSSLAEEGDDVSEYLNDGGQELRFAPT